MLRFGLMTFVFALTQYQAHEYKYGVVELDGDDKIAYWHDGSATWLSRFWRVRYDDGTIGTDVVGRRVKKCGVHDDENLIIVYGGVSEVEYRRLLGVNAKHDYKLLIGQGWYKQYQLMLVDKDLVGASMGIHSDNLHIRETCRSIVNQIRYGNGDDDGPVFFERPKVVEARETET